MTYVMPFFFCEPKNRESRESKKVRSNCELFHLEDLI